MSGYLKWCARALIREPMAWAMVLITLGLIAAAMGCPAPWPQYTVSLGAIVVFGCTLRLALQVSYERYRREQQYIVDQIRGKQ
jgi:hypothetical protein